MDIQQAFDAGFDAVKAYVDNIADEFERRVSAIESRTIERGENGERGLPGTDGAPGKDGAPGRDGIGIADIVRDADGNLIAVWGDGRTKTVGNIAVRDGVDGKDGERGRDGKDGVDGKDGADGKNADMDVVRAMIDEAVQDAVENAVSGISIPKDGRDGVDGKDGKDGLNGKDGRDGVDGKDGTDGINGKDGADGIALAGAMQDIDGNLIITDTKGGVHNVGRVRGLDGANGVDGKDGEKGEDGFSLSDFDATLSEDCRTLVLSFERGDTSYNVELDFPAPLYRGVFKDGAQYERGDMVTFGGGVWHCNEATTDKPEATKAWTLAVKRGRDGKDGINGERGLPGPEGKPGKDLTQMGLDGSKW